MPKQRLTGTLDQQCDFLYNLALDKMAQGNYTGAAYALKEVVKYAPHYRDAQALLAEANARKTAQQRLLIAGLVGAVLFAGLGSWWGWANDLYLIGFAVIGAIVGYAVGAWLERFRLPFSRVRNIRQTPPGY
jgi:uncharacterized membrane protein YeaQ/YmgE (transglycosylase-associated protein family)